MFKYLSIEAEDVVSEATLRRFCNESAPTIDWLLAHGALLSSSGVFRKKVSYSAPQVSPLSPRQLARAGVRSAG